jgi:hypothetical protein
MDLRGRSMVVIWLGLVWRDIARAAARQQEIEYREGFPCCVALRAG